MSRSVYNPYLPSWEYTPDCEPHVFDGRVYVFGSHDSADGQRYCLGDYVAWSAPEDDLTRWTFEGVIYTRFDDPCNTEHSTYMAPDVCQGPDGRYYLYYFYGFERIGVAVCDEPAGHYRYLGNIHLEDGTEVGPGKGLGAPFDPAVYVEGEEVYLFYGFGARPTDGGRFNPPPEFMDGAYVARLKADMVTIDGLPISYAPGPRDAAGTSFEEHPFLEASSFRRLGGRYYFVYSSAQGHELCWATTPSPLEPPTFGGVIISNGDVGINGIESEDDAVYYLGNNHGGLVEANGQTYVFYHRHTHGNQTARQDCAEPVRILDDGTIPQVEITSCGLNGGPLPATAETPAYACCHLRSSEGILHYSSRLKWREPHPFVDQEDPCDTRTSALAFVHNLRDGAEVGYKYLAFGGDEKSVSLTVRGKEGEPFSGEVSVRVDAPNGIEVARVGIGEGPEHWHVCQADLASAVEGTHAVYLVPEGEGSLDLASFSFTR